jgi:hypothetical protein
VARPKWQPIALYALVALPIIAPHIVPWTQISKETYAFGDSVASLWSFWWTDRAVLEWTNPFWTEYLFHPYGISLAFHNYALTYSLFSIPFQHAVPGPHGFAIAFNTIVFLSFVFSGWGAYRLARYVTGSERGAFIAGLLYTLAPYHILNSPRLAVLAIELLPFYILALLQLAEQPTYRGSVRLSAWLAIAYYTSVEYALYLVLFSGLWLGHRALTKRLDRPLVGHLAGSALLFFVLASPLLVQQFETSTKEPGSVGGQLEAATQLSPAVLSFVTPSREHPLYGKALHFAGTLGDNRTRGMRSETSFCLTGWLLALVALLGSRRGGRGFWVVVSAVFLTLSLGPYLRVTGTWSSQIPLPYLALYKFLPPIQAVKEPSRMLPVAFLALSVLGAWGVQEIANRLERRRFLGFVAVGLIGSLVVFENLTAWPWQRLEHMTLDLIPPGAATTVSEAPCCDAFYEQLANEPGDFAVMVVDRHELHTILAQIQHGRRVSEFHGFVPRAAAAHRSTPFNELHEDLVRPRRMVARGEKQQAASEQGYRQALRDADVRYIAVPSMERRRPVRALLERLGADVRTEGRLLVGEFPHSANEVESRQVGR